MNSSETICRVKQLKLENFRGFRKETKLDLDADLVLITGKNGVGKSSILYALDLLLNGETEFLTNKERLCHFESGEKKQYDAAISMDTENGKGEGSTLNGTIQEKGNKFNRTWTPIPAQAVFDPKVSEISEGVSLFLQESVDTLGISSMIEMMTPKTPIDVKEKLKGFESWIKKLKDDHTPEDSDMEIQRGQYLRMFWEKLKTLKNQGFSPMSDVQLMNDSAPEKLEQNLIFCAKDLARSAGIAWEGKPENILTSLELLEKTFSLFREKKAKEVTDSSEEALQDLVHRCGDAEVTPVERAVVEKAPEKLSHVLTGIALIPPELLQQAEQYLKELGISIGKMRSGREQLVKKRAWWDEIPEVGCDFGSFLEILQTCAVRATEDKLPKDLTALLVAQASQVPELQDKYRAWDSSLKNEIDKRRVIINEKEKAVQLWEDSLLLSKNCANDCYLMAETGPVTVRALLPDIKAPDSATILSVLGEVVNDLQKWIREEVDSEQKHKKWLSSCSYRDGIQKIIDAASEVLKKETGNSSIFSRLKNLEEDEATRLTKEMNQLLHYFHFEEGFLPIDLQVLKKKDVKLVTREGKGPSFDDLSTGQQTQVALCWTLGLNYALGDSLHHRIVMIDDLTTSLDLSQLIPAAVLLRQMAYADEEDAPEDARRKKRQVIITSHHEDQTHRMLDFLMPPKGKTMKIVEFADWNVENGPTVEVHEVRGQGDWKRVAKDIPELMKPRNKGYLYRKPQPVVAKG